MIGTQCIYLVYVKILRSWHNSEQHGEAGSRTGLQAKNLKKKRNLCCTKLWLILLAVWQ